VTDDTPPLQSSSELRNAIFKADGEHDSPNPEAPEAQNSDMLESASPEPISGQTRGASFRAVKPEYYGMAKLLAKIVILNIFLNMVTVRFYRFWGKISIRNYIWSHLHFWGEGFEYRGTGKELFFGFLIALLALVPVLIGFSVLSVAIPNPTVNSVLGLFQGLLFLFLFHFAVYRAR
jgi:uncharacterized membrane protein YjgN (DUF898 family)